MGELSCSVPPESEGLRRAFLEIRKGLRLIHHTPGRLRLRLDPRLWTRTNTDLGRKTLQELGAAQGIKEVKINPLNGSVTIHYDPENITPPVWEALLEAEETAAGDAFERLLS